VATAASSAIVIFDIAYPLFRPGPPGLGCRSQGQHGF